MKWTRVSQLTVWFPSYCAILMLRTFICLYKTLILSKLVKHLPQNIGQMEKKQHYRYVEYIYIYDIWSYLLDFLSVWAPLPEVADWVVVYILIHVSSVQCCHTWGWQVRGTLFQTVGKFIHDCFKWGGIKEAAVWIERSRRVES